VIAFYCDHFVLPLPTGHRFPMEKYRLLRERFAGDPLVTLVEPGPASREDLEGAHAHDYVARILEGTLTRDEVRRIGFPWSERLVERSRRSVGGTIEAAEAALRDGFAANLAGGTHHAFADRGEGFCVFNDVAVAIRRLQRTGAVSRFAVLDLDVHQGNGTAAMVRDDPRVFTLSVHGSRNYPFHKETSDLDIELPDRADDEVFIEAVVRGVDRALEARPELAFYVAGADPFEGDRLGRLGVSKESLRERDRALLDRCSAAGVAVVVVMGGGYAADVTDTVDIHEATIRAAAARAVRGPGSPSTSFR